MSIDALADTLLRNAAAEELGAITDEVGIDDLTGMEALALLAILRGVKERIAAEQRPPGQVLRLAPTQPRRGSTRTGTVSRRSASK